MAQTIDLLKNSSFEQGMADLVTAIQTQSNHSHANATILNAITAPYTTEEKADVATIRNKVNTTDLSAIALTGDYSDLKNVPTSLATIENKVDKTELSTVALSGKYDDLLDKPPLSDVATSGSFTDLKNIPNSISTIENKVNKTDLATVATSGNYNDLLNTPSLSNVATSGSFDDLKNIPSSIATIENKANKSELATVATSGSYNDLKDVPSSIGTIGNKANKSDLATVAFSGNYSDLKNIPTEFSMPTASETVLGGIKVGSGLSITSAGVLSASGAVSSVNGKTGKVTISASDVNAYSKTEMDDALSQFYADPYIATSISGKTLKIKAQASESEVASVVDSIYQRLDIVEGSVAGIIYSESEPINYAVGTTWIDG